MANGAVVCHSRKTNDFLSEANGHFPPFLPNEPKRAIAARAWQVVRENAWQHDPNPIRHSATELGANRAILKAIGFIGPLGLRLLAEELMPANAAEDDKQEQWWEQFENCSFANGPHLVS